MGRTKRVRGDSGAIFEVDESMVDAPPPSEDYRASTAPPSVREIQPAPPPPRFPIRAVLIAAIVIAATAVLVALVR